MTVRHREVLNIFSGFLKGEHEASKVRRPESIIQKGLERPMRSVEVENAVVVVVACLVDRLEPPIPLFTHASLIILYLDGDSDPE